MTADLTPSDLNFLANAERICKTKASFVTRAEAKAMLKRHNHQGQPYLCPWCNNWHITTQDRGKARRFKRRLSQLRRSVDAASTQS